MIYNYIAYMFYATIVLTINEAGEISAVLEDEAVDVLEILDAARGQTLDDLLSQLKQLAGRVALGVHKYITT